MMRLLTWGFGQLAGPLLIPGLIIGLLTMGGLVIRAHDARVTAPTLASRQ